MFRMTGKTQGGIADDFENPEHPYHEVFSIIISNEPHPLVYETRQVLDWMNIGVEIFGYEGFKEMILTRKDMKRKELE